MAKMRNTCSAMLLILAALTAPGQEVKVQTDDGKVSTLAKADIESLPRVKVTVGTGDSAATYEGAALKAVLEKGGVEFGDSLKGKRLASCLLVQAADGYQVVIALPEIDPAFVDKQILFAYLKDGKPLDAKEAPFRIVIPDEKRMARWVRQVTTLKIAAVQ
jgi:hypothetical protein